MTDKKWDHAGLTSAEARELQCKFGKNEQIQQKKQRFITKAFQVICEPMFLLLLIAAVIYFILGEPMDGAVMLIFVIAMISIDILQEWKTDKTLHALKDLSAPRITVLRDDRKQEIASTDLVPGDVMMICEGTKIPADGTIIKCNDLCVDESSLTGEAEGAWKNAVGSVIEESDFWRKDYCYAGTLVMQGSAAVLVEKIGAETEYGKISRHIADALECLSPLQKQTRSLIKFCTGIAAILFVLVTILTYFNLSDYPFSDRLVQSILSGVTLAMAMIPEEFPVVFTVFLSMGAWRLAQKKSLMRKLPAVETLGAVSVLCVDKTGTITMNQMKIQSVWAANKNEHELLEMMGMACETDPYDPMEKAMLSYCDTHGISRTQLFSGELIAEYALSNEQKMMGHVWRRDGEIIIAAKGSPEKIITICNIDEENKNIMRQKLKQMSGKGLRVIAVAFTKLESEKEIPNTLADCRLTFLGMVGLADPPRPNIKNDITVCSQAGIRVIMITGDNGWTAASIARQVGIQNCNKIITGEMLDHFNDEELREKVKTVNVFSRVVPEHKMRIVKALKENGEIVAMTGDGVNDAPALKHADIGIAMGERGSEVSREAADFILMDDNFTTIVETVKDGRRIYDNLRKAVGYIFTIHIPIALTALFAPLLGISPDALFLLPLHIVLLELLIDPTCSIVFERQPAEQQIMKRSPRAPTEKLLYISLLAKSILQGIVMFVASFGAYVFLLNNDENNAPLARSMGIVILVLANLFLVLVNSSAYDYAYQSFRRLMKDRVMQAVFIGTLFLVAVMLYTPMCGFLKLAPLSAIQLTIAIVISVLSVFWYEAVKMVRKQFQRK